MGIRRIIHQFLKSGIGQRFAHFYLSLNSWLEEEHRNEQGVLFYEKLYREEFFANSMRFLSFNKIEGDYLEFGCHSGMTFGLAHKYKHIAGLNLRLFGFDSFKGLPKLKGFDVHAQWKEGMFAMGMAEFAGNLKSLGLLEKEFTLIPGFYDESLTKDLPSKLGLRKAALVYVDCDLYESTVQVLSFVLPLLQTGSIVAFDDFYCFNGDPERGGQRALKEFLIKNQNIKMTEYLNFGWHGKSFIVKKYTGKYCRTR